ncbi:MAG: M20/M25/M40 family metallo-hydrolase [Gemmatimonadetes bacterium]|nr:M20/M25/M40 family metallo-hydrolase [Gemmatimonadota bacterium]
MTQPVASLTHHPALVDARDQLARTDELTLATQATLSAIPAPTGGESARAVAVAREMERVGLRDIGTDAVGNVSGWLGAPVEQPAVVVAAHLDTVFGPEVDVSVRRTGRLLTGPGIADNARGLAGMLALGRVTATPPWKTVKPVAFVATVGEEGAGDLRGIKHLFGERRLEADSVIVLDGAGDDRIVYSALGTRRFRVTYRGPGGHSWAAFGVPNPAHAAGALAHAVAAFPRSRAPRSACSVVGLHGGSGLNCIPESARVEIDLRSEDHAMLVSLEKRMRAQSQMALEQENARRSAGTAPLQLTIDVIGDRPSGGTPADHPLVIAGIEATRAIGRQPGLATASTDANIPISLGIPAIALGAGGKAGEPHRTTEWFENADGALGLYRALLVLAAAAGQP